MTNAEKLMVMTMDLMKHQRSSQLEQLKEINRLVREIKYKQDTVRSTIRELYGPVTNS